jgi:hypothetical protein
VGPRACLDDMKKRKFVEWGSVAIVKKIYLNILTDLHVFSSSEYKNVAFGMSPLSMYLCAPR